MTDIARKIDEAAARLATGVTVTEADLSRASRVVFADEIETLHRVMAEQAETIRRIEVKLSDMREKQNKLIYRGGGE